MKWFVIFTYNVSEREAKSQIRRYRVHEVKHVGLICLVLKLNMAVVEVLLDAPLHLSHSLIW